MDVPVCLRRLALGLRAERKVVHTGKGGLEESVIPDLKAVLVNARLRGLGCTLLQDMRCLLIELLLRELVRGRGRGRRRVKRGKIAHVDDRVYRSSGRTEAIENGGSRRPREVAVGKKGQVMVMPWGTGQGGREGVFIMSICH